MFRYQKKRKINQKTKCKRSVGLRSQSRKITHLQNQEMCSLKQFVPFLGKQRPRWPQKDHDRYCGSPPPPSPPPPGSRGLDWSSGKQWRRWWNPASSHDGSILMLGLPIRWFCKSSDDGVACCLCQRGWRVH